MTRRRDPTTVGDVLAKSARLQRPGYLSWWLWRDIVGDRVAARSKPLSLERGTLLLRVQSSLWAQELSLLAPMVKEGLLQRGIHVQNIRFSVGEVSVPSPRPAVTRPKPHPLSAELTASLDKIDDPELREAIRRAASLSPPDK